MAEFVHTLNDPARLREKSQYQLAQFPGLIQICSLSRI
jgi:hypothetical protein